jgi:nucleotide-binding universal stress UspA family protein
MKTILVPLDGSALAEQVLPYVQLLAPLLGARVHLLRSIPAAEEISLPVKAGAALAEGGSPLDPAVCEQCTLAGQCAHTDCYIASQAMRLRGAGVEADADVRVGAPAVAITEAAAEWPDTLVAMATHGDSGLRRWARGSIADRVLHDTTLPLLLVRGTAPPTPRLRRILVLLDGSALRLKALPLAIDLAARAHAELIAPWIVAPSIEEYLRDFPPTADVRRSLHQQVLQAFEALAGAPPPQSVLLTTATAIGPAASAIAAEADRRRVDLIVMATHGYIGLQRWWQGSVAAEVLHATTTPLLLMRAHVAEEAVRSA